MPTVSKIIVKLKDREIELTPEEARELHRELALLFQAQTKADQPDKTAELLEAYRRNIEEIRRDQPIIVYPPPVYVPVPVNPYPSPYPNWPNHWVWCEGPTCFPGSTCGYAGDAVGGSALQGTLTMNLSAQH